MKGITGHATPFQTVGKLSGKQHITEFAMAVGHKTVPQWLSHHQILVCVQSVEVHRAQTMQRGWHVDDSALAWCLQPIKQQQSQQKVSQVVHLKHHAKAVLSSACYHQSYRKELKITSVIYHNDYVHKDTESTYESVR